MNYFISGLLAVAGSALKFWWIVMLWSEKKVLLPLEPNVTGAAVIA
jgi:hypothetical protein